MQKVHGCQLLNERTEICLAINSGEYPVLWIEIGKPKDGWDAFTVYKGSRARIIYRTERWGDLIYNAELSMYWDEQEERFQYSPCFWSHIHLKSEVRCIKSEYGYSDIIESVENAQSPMLDTNQEVIVVFKDSNREVCWVRKMVTGSRIDPHCSTMLMIENPKEKE